MNPSSFHYASVERILLDRRKLLFGAMGCMVLSVVTCMAGWLTCEILVKARVSAGEGFERIDQASDYLFIGFIAGFVLFLLSLIVLARRFRIGNLLNRVNTKKPPAFAGGGF